MRFLILTQYFPPEIAAPPVRLAAMVRHLVRAGQSVEVVTAMPNHPVGRIAPEYAGRLYMRDEWEGVTVHRVWLYASMGAGARRMLNYASFVLTSGIGLSRAGRPDYVFVESPPVFLSLAGYLAARRWSARLIVNVADLWVDALRELSIVRDGALLDAVEALERWSYRKAAFVNTVTEGLRRVLIEKKGVPPEKLLFLPNGVDTDLFRPRPPHPGLAAELGVAGKRVVLYAGTHGLMHGLESALDAARILREKHAIVFLFVGGGSEKPQLLKKARELGLSSVRFMDPVPPERLALIYSIADVALSTLRPSALVDSARPVKALTSMACGVPVVYAGSGEGARLIEAAGGGIVTPPGSGVEIARAIERLLDDPPAGRAMGASGRAYVEANLGWPSLIHSWLDQLARGVAREPS